MTHVYEFEMFKDEEGWFLALPFDMEGGTQGGDFKEACAMAADRLRTEMEHRDMHGIPFPEATFGNEPREGGTVVVAAVDAGKETVPRMTASAAAKVLGVTRGARFADAVRLREARVVRVRGQKWVSRYSVEARLAEKPRAGRPKKAGKAARRPLGVQRRGAPKLVAN